MAAPRVSSRRRHERGQILLLLALILPVLILFTGMAIDFGLAYVDETTLSRAVDAAALEGARNLYLGNSTAQQLANDVFNANIATVKTAGTTVFNFNVVTDASQNKEVNVSGTINVTPYFLAIIPGFPNPVPISATAQALRSPLIMSVVLDKSGSMSNNGGKQALPSAVQNFIANFDDNIDKVADISFSTLSSVDFAINRPFKSQIDAKVNSINWGGGTNSAAGLSAGKTQIDNATATVPAGQNVVRVMVFFTDGWANLVDVPNFPCKKNNGRTVTTTVEHVLLGGCAPLEASAGWCSGFFDCNPSTGSCGTESTDCNASTSYTSPNTGATLAITPTSTAQNNTSQDAMASAVSVSNSAFHDMFNSEGITIYSIGLGDKVSSSFLAQIANDPTSGTYNSNLPIGAFEWAQTSSDLDHVFEIIASKILLRLTQ